MVMSVVKPFLNRSHTHLVKTKFLKFSSFYFLNIWFQCIFCLGLARSLIQESVFVVVLSKEHSKKIVCLYWGFLNKFAEKKQHWRVRLNDETGEVEKKLADVVNIKYNDKHELKQSKATTVRRSNRIVVKKTLFAFALHLWIGFRSVQTFRRLFHFIDTIKINYLPGIAPK